jgi:hypothetical protein
MLESLKQRLFGHRAQGEPIVIVSGLPRSGTSMLMRMLEAGGLRVMTDSLREADVDNPKGYFEHERVKDLEKEEDKSYILEGRGKVLKVISFLIKDLPDDNDYRVIFMRRDLSEVLASQNKMIDRLGTEDTTAQDEAMKEAYRNDIVRTRLMCKKRPNFELIEIHYRSTIEDTAGSAAAVNAFLGGRLDESAMRDAVDSSLYRNRAGAQSGSEPS